MTPANLLTILRVLLVPVFVLLVLYGFLAEALLAFLMAGFTDLLDGLIARKFNQRSQLGTLLDPIADKLLLVSSFVVLTVESVGLQVRIPLWLTISVISRDVLLVAAVIAVNIALGRHFFPPSLYGKWTTVFQLLTVLLVLIANFVSWVVPLIRPVFFVTLALTVFSGLHYLSRGIRHFEQDQSSNRGTE